MRPAPQTDPLPLVYDVGMNNGDDTAYYLAKGLQVVGIDANSEMCSHCEGRFAAEIKAGRLAIINCGVTDEPGCMNFYVNVEKPAISTFLPERFDGFDWVPPRWSRVKVDVVRLSDIIARHGNPHFIKIDVEHFDARVLRELRDSGVRPTYLSAEAHEEEVLNTILEMGYGRFQIVSGESVPRVYKDWRIARLDGSSLTYSFPLDSSGPFGEDLEDKWVSEEEITSQLRSCGFGWVDIHARAGLRAERPEQRLGSSAG